MPEQKNANTETSPPSAEQLRMQMLEREMEQMDKERKLRSMQEQKLTDFAADFLEKHVTEQEIAVVRRLVANAVKDGKFEAMVYSFPSSLCTDSGRAINNADRDWPSTLQGKAKEFYERYQTFGKPQGDDHQFPRRHTGRCRLLPRLVSGPSLSGMYSRMPNVRGGPRGRSLMQVAAEQCRWFWDTTCMKQEP